MRGPRQRLQADENMDCGSGRRLGQRGQLSLDVVRGIDQRELVRRACTCAREMCTCKGQGAEESMGAGT